MKRTFVVGIALGVYVAMLGSALGAGGATSGGGGGILCPERAEILDLWEAETPGVLTETGLRVPRLNDSVETQIDVAVRRLGQMNPGFASALREELNAVSNNRKPIPQETRLAPPRDTRSVLLPQGCELIGLANYDDSRNLLLFDPAQVDRLGPTDIAALWVHEALYRLLRVTEGATDSIKARTIVGYLFSDFDLPSVADQNPLAFDCSYPDGTPAATLTTDGSSSSTVHLFHVQRGAWIFGDMTVTIGDRKLAELFRDASHLPVTGDVYVSKVEKATGSFESLNPGLGAAVMVSQRSRENREPGVFIYLQLPNGFLNNIRCELR